MYNPKKQFFTDYRLVTKRKNIKDMCKSFPDCPNNPNPNYPPCKGCPHNKKEIMVK